MRSHVCYELRDVTDKTEAEQNTQTRRWNIYFVFHLAMTGLNMDHLFVITKDWRCHLTVSVVFLVKRPWFVVLTTNFVINVSWLSASFVMTQIFMLFSQNIISLLNMQYSVIAQCFCLFLWTRAVHLINWLSEQVVRSLFRFFFFRF